MSGSGVHILVFPFPAQGHMLPLLDLTHQLALHGLTITILVTPNNLPIIDSLLSAHPASIKALIFPFPHHPSLPSNVENVKDIGNSGNVPIINALSKLRDPILSSGLSLTQLPLLPSSLISSLAGPNAWPTNLVSPGFVFTCLVLF